jgi:hypothetical protein
MALRRQAFASTARNSKKLRQPLQPAVKHPPKADPSSQPNLSEPALGDFDPRLGLRKMTFAERFPGLQVEAVLNPDAPGRLGLCIKDSKSTEVRPFLEHDGFIYLPGRVPPGLGQVVRFPAKPSDSGSTEKLQSEMKKFLSKTSIRTPKLLTC